MATKEIHNYTAATTIDGAADLLLIDPSSTGNYNSISRNVLLGVTGTPADLSTSQAFTNKTIGNTNNATLKDGSFTLQNSSSTTKQAQFSLASITAGNTRTYTLPDITDTLATLTAAQTLTNKTLTSPTINSPTITNATITADTVSGFTTSNSGTVYGIAVSTGQITTANSIGTGTIVQNGVAASQLATSAITLGYAQITSNVTSTSSPGAQLTGLTVSVTIPSGGRKIKITVYGLALFNSATSPNYGISLWDGTVGSGTQIQAAQFNNTWTSGSALTTPVTLVAVVTPSAGSKTYNVGGFTSSGTMSLAASSTSPAFILVECI